MIRHYIVDDDKQIVEVDFITWARWLEANHGIPGKHRVAETLIGEIVISTVFLGLDHGMSRFGTDDEPIVFETMIFGGAHDMFQARYSTWAEAEAGHEQAVQMAYADYGKQP